jgi:hypothetical protein
MFLLKAPATIGIARWTCVGPDVRALLKAWSERDGEIAARASAGASRLSID